MDQEVSGSSFEDLLNASQLRGVQLIARLVPRERRTDDPISRNRLEMFDLVLSYEVVHV